MCEALPVMARYQATINSRLRPSLSSKTSQKWAANESFAPLDQIPNGRSPLYPSVQIERSLGRLQSARVISKIIKVVLQGFRQLRAHVVTLGNLLPT